MKTLNLTEEQILLIDEALNFYGEDIRGQIDFLEETGGDLEEISDFEKMLEEIDEIQKAL